MASLRNAEDVELDPQYDNEQLANISADEPTADAPQDEDEEHRRIQRVKNTKRTQRRRNAQNHTCEQRDLNNNFVAVVDWEYVRRLAPSQKQPSYPKEFKPAEIPKYDGNQDPRQWIRCYSIAIEASGGSNSTKALYFPVAPESAPLTWLESLKPNSIDSWEDLKRAFVDNFQGSMIKAGTRICPK
jgi:hypothetical protein